MNIALWVVQALLAFAFGAAGSWKLTTSNEDLLAAGMTWVNYSPIPATVIGGLELAGAIGLILPAALRIAPMLTPAAAGGLVLTMIGAAIGHATHGEMGNIGANLMLGGLAAFVAWGRAVRAPIAPR